MLLEKMKNCRKLSRTCSIHGKHCEISGPYNFRTPASSNILDVWNWNSRTLFGLGIEVWGWGAGGAWSPYPIPHYWLRPWPWSCTYPSSCSSPKLVANYIIQILFFHSVADWHFFFSEIIMALMVAFFWQKILRRINKKEIISMLVTAICYQFRLKKIKNAVKSL